MKQELVGRVAIITGASRGIGRAITQAFITAGARVVLNDIDQSGEEVAATLRKNGAAATYVDGDVRDPDAMANVAKVTMEQYGRIDVLCPNAGIYPRSSISEMPLEEWNRVLAVNLTGVFLAVRACLPIMQAQRYGRIIATGSITGAHVGQPTLGHYAATKAGLVGFIRCLALEVASHGITANCVEPGNIQSYRPNLDPRILDAQLKRIPLGRFGEPAEIGAAVIFLASEAAAFITGQSLVIDGGQILPEYYPF